jgi:hypothetical protein
MDNWTLQNIIDHVKELENDNSASDLFLKKLSERFTWRYAQFIDDSKLITSASVNVPTSGYQTLSLETDFLRPLTNNSFWFGDDRTTKYDMMRLSMGVKKSTEDTHYKLLYIKGNEITITAPASGTLNYWYIKKPEAVALSVVPDISTEHLIEGIKIYYENAQGYTSKEQFDSEIRSQLQQAMIDAADIDKRINNQILQTNSLGGKLR